MLEWPNMRCDYHNGKSVPCKEDTGINLGPLEPDYISNGVPVFRPSWEDFKDFKQFIKRVDGYGMRSGIIKVIPPKQWRDSLPDLSEKVKDIRLRHPIEQHISGNGGLFRQANIERWNIYNLAQWRKLCDCAEHQPPAPRGQIRMNGSVSKAKTSTTDRSQMPPSPRSEDENVFKGEKMERVEHAVQEPLSPASIVLESCKKDDRELDSKTDCLKNAKRNLKKNNCRADVSLEEDFEDFDYHLPNVADYTDKRCAELEKVYWKTLTYATPLYGADMPGSLFDQRTKEWNVAKLDNLLSQISQSIPGVNTAYLYLGMWKATFSWHVEDMDLYSINYIHFGAPKQWYSIGQADSGKFESVMKNTFPNDYQNCAQFLRHKTFHASPTRLKLHDIKVNKVVHHEGEFIVTFPYGYHSGYNLGYNCAESVNFATDSWLDYGKKARKCECIPDAVQINMEDIMDRLANPDAYLHEREIKKRKPKLTNDSKAPKRRKRNGDKANENVKKGSQNLKPKVEVKDVCVLCPDQNIDDLLPTAKPGKFAHRLCATYIPETWIGDSQSHQYEEEDQAMTDVDESPEKSRAENESEFEEIVGGVELIPKARTCLKCVYCGVSRGACFQCDQDKCVRAYHATCAAAAGVLVELFEHESEVKIHFLCRFHRPKRSIDVWNQDGREYALVKRYCESLYPGEIIQIQFRKPDIFTATVVAIENEEDMVYCESGDGQRLEVSFHHILAPPTRSNEDMLRLLSQRSNDLKVRMKKSKLSTRSESTEKTAQTPTPTSTMASISDSFASDHNIANPTVTETQIDKSSERYTFVVMDYAKGNNKGDAEQ